MHRGNWPSIELPGEVRQFLEAALERVQKSALFAFAVRVLVGATLVDFDPVGKIGYAVKKVTPAELMTMQDALALIGTRPSNQPNGMLLFLVASFARNQMLYGTRGYRRTLVEAGGLIEHILQQAKASNSQSTLWLEFVDRRIDAFAEADGIEEGTAAVMEMRWDAHAHDS
jgi:hypothetical protein